MKMIFWKEFREQWPKLLIATVLLFAVYATALVTFDLNPDPDYMSQGMAQDRFLMFSWMGCIMLGTAMPLAQFLPEILWRDHWASVLHLPVDRGTYFIKRAAAGLILYAITALIPLLLAMLLFYIPGLLAEPLTPAMTLGGLFDILRGMMFYLAALHGVLQMRGGFWRRGLALILILPAIPLTLYVSEGISFLVIAYIGLACYGNALSQGVSDRQPWYTRAINATLLPGVLIMVFGFMSMTLMLVVATSNRTHSIWTSWYEMPGYGYVRTMERHTSRGMIYEMVLKADGTSFVPKEEDFEKMRSSAAGQNFQSTEIASDITSTEYSGAHNVNAYTNINANPDKIHYRKPEKYVDTIRLTGLDTEVQWYYMYQHRYFVSYNRKKRFISGYLGKNGFVEKLSDIQSFDKGDQLCKTAFNCCIWNKSRIYSINLNAGQVAIFREAPTGDIVRLISLFGDAYYQSNPSLAQSVILYKDRIEFLFLNKTALTALTIPYRKELGEHRRLMVSLRENGPVHMHYSPTLILPSEWATSPDYVEIFGPTGIKTGAFTIPNARKLPKVKSDVINGGLLSLASMIAAPPGALTLISLMQSMDAGRMKDKVDLHTAASMQPPTEQTLISQWPGILFLSALGVVVLILVPLAWPIARRQGKPRYVAWGWVANCLFFGLSGFVSLLLEYKRQPRKTCPKCTKTRPVTEELCPHCQAPWPAPERNGSEIYDQPGEAAAVSAGPATPPAGERIAVG